MISQRGVVEFYDVIAIDVQRHKELEQELQRNAQVALVGQLAAGISHDFNNYLSAIVGQLDAALAQAREEGPLSVALHAAKKGAMSCANMASQLLNIGKGRSNSPRDVDLNEVVHEVCTLVSRVIPNKITLRVSTYPRPIYTQGERVQLQQVVINLLLNARDAMPNGGVLSVQVGSAAPSSNPNSSSEGVAAFITVQDTGLGMSPESVRRIFTPFYTTKSRTGGTGLGLSMVKMIIEAHHGWLDVVSEEGEGSAFTVYLPLIKKEIELKSATINPKLAPPPTLGLRNIAIAEDDDMIRNMLSTALSSMGCDVEVFSNGVLLLDYLKSGTATCDFIIIDDSMPKARGVELLESLRGLLPNADVILTSGDPSVAQDPALKRFGVRFLAKPFPLSELIAILK
jgi:two-component system cell cycle sensor histidine kinase/response regulator CckA